MRFLAGPGQAAQTLLEGVWVVFPTRHGRIVYEDAREPGEPTPLRVMLPDERIVEIEERIMRAFGLHSWGNEWPLDRDEVVYAVEEDGQMVLRRTVLP